MSKKQPLQITQDTAKQLYATAAPEFKTMLEESFGKASLCPNVTERLKTIQDCFDEIGFDKSEFDEKYKGLPNAVKSWVLMTDIIAPAINGDWEPDWDNNQEYKYYPWFKMSGGGFSFYVCGSGYTATVVGARLVFKSRELAEYAGKQFADVYKQFMVK